MRFRTNARLALLCVAVLAIFCIAAAKGYVLSDGQGTCVTVTFNTDEKGNTIGTTSVTAACNIPEGSYPFALVVADKPGATQGNQPLRPGSLEASSAEYFSRQARLAARELRRPNSPAVIKNRTYAESLLEGLTERATAHIITIAVTKADPLAIFAPAKR